MNLLTPRTARKPARSVLLALRAWRDRRPGVARPAVPVGGAVLVLAFASCVAPGFVGSAAAQTVRSDFFITNGTVNAEALSGNTLYIGGAFSAVGPITGAGIPIDASTSLPLAGFPHVIGAVNAVASDGAGGWYIGGAFTSVGGLARANLAHVLSDLSVDSWDPGASNTVRVLRVSGGLIYVGGDFTTVGGQPRPRIAALSAGTGLATVWNPSANASVRALVVDGGTVYAGGDFITIGGESRMRIAALDAGTGLATAWDPTSTGSVRALAVDGSTVYAAGLFSTIGGLPRNFLAALDASTGLASSWNPIANNSVLAIAVDGGTVYAGGTFTSIGGQTRTRIAAVDAVTGLATSWAPNANAQVLALAVEGGTVYAGGDFATVGARSRNRLAAIDAVSGISTPWNPNAFGSVSALAVGGGTVYAGGSFNGMGGVPRANLAALDVVSGQATSWAPDADSPVQALALNGATVYAGGSFANAGGQSRANLAALDASTGLATSWTPDADGTVQALAVSGALVYVGGSFSRVGGPIRNNLAAVDATTGLATAWNPDVDGNVFAIATDASTVHAGGFFSHAGGQPRNNLVALSAATGLATAWNPNPNGTVRALSVGCASVYAGGFFTNVGGQSRDYIAALDRTTAAVTVWNPNADGPVYTIALTGGTVYVSGVLGFVGGQPRNRIAALDAASGLATPWNPNASDLVRAIVLGPGGVYAGGLFTSIGGLTQSSIAAITADNSITCPSVTLTPGTLPSGRAGTLYGQDLDASGGSAPFCFALTAGALPDGLTLDPGTGGIAGTPTLAGTFAFTVTATNAIGCTGSQAYGVLILPACPPIAILPATLADGMLGSSFIRTLTTSAGTAPFTFEVSSGGLPDGLSLIAATGEIIGTPTLAGTSTFTIGVTDTYGCTGSRAYSLVINPPCQPQIVLPGALADGSAVAAYLQTLTDAAGVGPYLWSIASGSLPPGLVLTPATGEIAGTPSTVGTYSFKVAVVDAHGCTGERDMSVQIFDSAPLSSVAADPSGVCITTAQPCSSVPVRFTRGESAPARGTSVTFQIDLSKLALCTPATPALSIHRGHWLDGYAETSLLVIDNGGGSYTVDEAILGLPCGNATGGELFTVDLTSVIPGDGAGTITVTASRARDCDNGAIATLPGAPASLTIDHSGPPAITDLAAAQQLGGNGPGSMTGITLSWTTGVALAALYRAPFGNYPVYDHNVVVAPPTAASAPGGPWTLVAASAGSGYVDHPPTRGFWYYVALTSDACLATATSNMTPGRLDYHLGDVSDGLTQGQGNNSVATEDVSLLGAFYGISDPDIVLGNVQYLDVGPTTDHLPTSRPTPDGVLDFEDLMMFSTNYGVVTGPQASVRSTPIAAAARGSDAFSIEAPSLVSPGAPITAAIRLSATGAMQGFSAHLAWDASVVQPIAMHSSGMIEALGGVVLSAHPGSVDAALLGVRGSGMIGSGDVAQITFRVLRLGDAAIRIANVDARDADNRRLDAGATALSSPKAPPSTTVLLGPRPNPFHGDAMLGFTLAQSGPVELAIYSVDGRRVRTLTSGPREAGVYHVVWDGRDDGGRTVAVGVFYAHLSAGGKRFTERLVHLE